jgi:hypothetical protein
MGREYQGASDAMLAAKLASTIAELAQIKNDLDAHQLESVENDWEIETPEWVKLRSRKRTLGIVHQDLLREVGERKRIAKQRQGMSFANRFVNVARARLDKKTFSTLWAVASGKDPVFDVQHDQEQPQ